MNEGEGGSRPGEGIGQTPGSSDLGEVTHHGAQGEPEVEAPQVEAPQLVDRHGGPVPDGPDEPASTPGVIEPPASSAPGTYRAVLRTPGFLRLWASQVVSNVGDWAYVLAVAIALSSRSDTAQLPRVIAIVLAFEAGTSAVVGLFVAGPAVDRFSRRRLMITADVVRALAVGSLLLVGAPSALHLMIVGTCLGAFRAVFQPALMSSLPNIVPADRLMAANALVSGTFHMAIMTGPMIGAGLVALLGVRAAFFVNSLSFVVSAMLLKTAAIPRSSAVHTETWHPVQEFAEGARHVARSPLARGIAVVMGFVLFLSAAQNPMLIAFVRVDLAPAAGQGVRAGIIGLLTAAWGSGMVAGSFLAPALARRLSRERLLSLAVAAAGTALLVASRTTDVRPVACSWAVAGIASGIANVSYETLLQERTPDRFRGRVLSTVEAVQDGMFFLGALTIATFGGLVAPAAGLALLGIGFLAVGIAARSIVPVGAGLELVIPVGPAQVPSSR
jgi:MFS family permease